MRHESKWTFFHMIYTCANPASGKILITKSRPKTLRANQIPRLVALRELKDDLNSLLPDKHSREEHENSFLDISG